METPSYSSPPSNIASLSLALLFVTSVTASLFFNGMYADYFALAMSLLLVWVATLCWQGRGAKYLFPHSWLLIALALYQTWLLVTLIWNPVPYLGINYFLLLATPLLVLFSWNQIPSPEQLWRYIWPLLLMLGSGLMIYALYQYYWLIEDPRATFVNRNSLAAMLNLLMLVAVSRLLLVAKRRRLLFVLLLIGTLFSALLIGLIGSRGAFLGLASSMLFLVGWGGRYQQKARRKIWLALGVIGLGLVLSNLSFVNLQQRQLSDRLETLSDPYSAGNDRFLIWGQSLKMAQEKPLTGYGLGTYWQHWPQWRDPADSTDGFWAHNDFLHLWVEAGLPAVVLLLSVHAVLLLLLWRILRSPAIQAERKEELIALSAGLLAVAVHAQFSFHYYNLPILLVLSLIMARIARIEWDLNGNSGWSGPRWIRFSPSLSALLVALYFVTIGVSVLIFEQATKRMQQGDLLEADKIFYTAEKLWAATDIYPYTHALLKEQQLKSTPKKNIEQREKIFLEAQQLLDLALDNNPLRPVAYFIQGRLLVTAAELAGDDWLKRAKSAFKQSLKRAPQYLEARITLARILEVTGQKEDARALLEEGMIYRYLSSDPNMLTYYKMVATARNEAGDLAGASEMVERYNDIVRKNIGVRKIE